MRLLRRHLVRRSACARADVDGLTFEPRLTPESSDKLRMGHVQPGQGVPVPALDSRGVDRLAPACPTDNPFEHALQLGSKPRSVGVPISHATSGAPSPLQGQPRAFARALHRVNGCEAHLSVDERLDGAFVAGVRLAAGTNVLEGLLALGFERRSMLLDELGQCRLTHLFSGRFTPLWACAHAARFAPIRPAHRRDLRPRHGAAALAGLVRAGLTGGLRLGWRDFGATMRHDTASDTICQNGTMASIRSVRSSRRDRGTPASASASRFKSAASL